MTYEEGLAFANRPNIDALFVEASAKTATNVRKVFMDLVDKVLDTPELWNSRAPKGAPNQPGVAMPGNISLAQPAPGDSFGSGCSC